MKLTTYPTASAFLDAVGSSLGKREAEHHLVLGVAHAVASKGAVAEDLFAASVDDDNGIALAALMIGDRPLLVASDREDVGASAARQCINVSTGSMQ